MTLAQRLAALGLSHNPEGASMNATPETVPTNVPTGGAPASAEPQAAPAVTPATATNAPASADASGDIGSQVRQALAADRARSTAVMSAPECKGREAMATALLSDAKMSEHSADEIVAFLATMPLAAADAPKAGGNAAPEATPLYKSDGSPALDAQGKPITLEPDATKKSTPLYKSDGTPALDAQGKPITLEADSPAQQTDNRLYKQDGSPALDGQGNHIVISAGAGTEAGQTTHSFAHLMENTKNNPPIGAGGSGSGDVQGDPFSTGAASDARTSFLLTADREFNGAEGQLDAPEVLLRPGQTTPAPRPDQIAENGGIHVTSPTQH